ncbi:MULTISPECIES: hypothetical protein [Vibrio]|uniref:Uncharacterized protein n=1 Tax=Vibrio tasmaniensis TaxID=212663 RepID=A0A2N7NNA2_9VIBR|nr:hypothetical protein [Vibrio tasmaniensis]PMO83677.1 hypothetical protein BCT01_24515 [Vibrio tasmaniensis]PMP17685.1 hypothetical protein BCS92_24480 [Vibrio tasmaniensis]TKG27884.1 hypothetical protein FC057_22825 [Vibrio tasmaniensis]TKG35433.1 hypothetical protein FC063_24815 [Vibrio tasmaniensis]TKG41779.1 hypothetical protein FC061_23425 [Vibrio tasmaniensis]
MPDILINLDEQLFVPSVDVSLLSMVKLGKFTWPTGATCVTQECDGALLWWSASVDDVTAARQAAKPDTGLMPLIGLGDQVSIDYYLSNGQEVVANDWQKAVVTIDQFTNSKIGTREQL